MKLKLLIIGFVFFVLSLVFLALDLTFAFVISWVVICVVLCKVVLPRRSIPAECSRAVNRSLEVINQCVATIAKSKNWDTKKRNIDAIIETYDRLIEQYVQYKEGRMFIKNRELALIEKNHIYQEAEMAAAEKPNKRKTVD